MARNITTPRRLPGDRPAISQTGTDSLHNNAVEVRFDSFRCHAGAASAPCHSPGAGALFFIQIFATLGFAVLYSTLVLYATKRLGFNESSANAMMGVFGAFNYGLHMFGGYLGGRFLSNRNLFVLGMVLQVIGCALIAVAGVWGCTGGWRCS